VLRVWVRRRKGKREEVWTESPGDQERKWKQNGSGMRGKEGRLGHGHMGRGGHELGLAMHYLSTLCRQTAPEIALRLFQGWPTHRVGGLRPSSTPLDAPRRTPMDWNRGSRSESRWDMGNWGQVGKRRSGLSRPLAVL
jgi:hypothetical protein